MIIAASSGFWILNSYSIIEFFFKLRDFARYPISIFNSVFKFIFTFILPIGFIAYYPIQMFLKPEKTNFLVFFSPLIGIFLFIIANLIWKKGVNRYSGTGS